MKVRKSLIDDLLKSENKELVLELLNEIHVFLIEYDLFKDELYSNIFTMLYLTKYKYTYMQIANNLYIDTKKIFNVKNEIDRYCLKIINNKSKYVTLRKSILNV
ncbi:MAG: hypothetical protein IJA65_01165 [Acholeplasmatales bacterium]|nr:hypothetical protein [Acholeplasmatales bacterium]